MKFTAKKLPPVGLDLMPQIITGLGVSTKYSTSSVLNFKVILYNIQIMF